MQIDLFGPILLNKKSFNDFFSQVPNATGVARNFDWGRGEAK